MQSQNNKSAGTTEPTQFHKVRRRPRVTLSCDPCRNRKLRCNREQPCQNCTVRTEQATCKYRASTKGPIPSPGHDQTNIMQQRIDRLEGLVKTLVAKDQGTFRPNDSTPPDEANWSEVIGPPESRSGSGKTAIASDSLGKPSNAGTLMVTGDHSVYRNTSDWSDVLQEIAELKKDWTLVQDDSNKFSLDYDFSDVVDGPTLLCGQVKPVEMSELLATLPPMSQVDELIEEFFDYHKSSNPTVHVLHKPTFMRELSDHWKNPSETNVMWLGLLFSILCFTVTSYHQFSNGPPEYEGIADALSDLYRLRTSQCLMIGDITKGLPYTVETLMYNAFAEYSRKQGCDRGLWMMSGVTIRAAINMGYHREPSRHDNMTVLQAELRRRVWSCLRDCEGMVAFLVGFPSMMPAIDSDTIEPRNLFDWELTDDTTELPPSRPESEFTPVTYLIVKGRIMRATGLITNFNNLNQPGSYDRLLEIDDILQEAFEKVPSHMRISDTQPSQFQSMSTVAILQLEFLYHRGVCVLHRRYLALGRLDQRYSRSRDRCIASALALLAQQEKRHSEIQSVPSNLTPYWYKTSYISPFFVLAAMILCLDLEHRRRGNDQDASPSRDVLLEALKRSCAIWNERKTSSVEAWRVYHVLVNMLLSFGVDSFHNMKSSAASFQTNLPLSEVGDNQTIEGDQLRASNEMDVDWAAWGSFIEGTSFDDAYETMSFVDLGFDAITSI